MSALRGALKSGGSKKANQVCGDHDGPQIRSVKVIIQVVRFFNDNNIIPPAMSCWFLLSSIFLKQLNLLL